jgi:exodeoxyribonuclease VII large subunit
VLTIRYDKSSSKLQISGSSTFQAKEEIKKLGPSRWLSAEKAWEVTFFDGTCEQLRTRLSEYQTEIEEIGAQDQENGVGDAPKGKTSESSPAAQGYSVPELIGLARAALEERFSKSVLVYGVIGAIKRAGERIFITLSDQKDRTTSISCVSWRGVEQLEDQLKLYGFKLEPELEIMFQVAVSLNRKNGSLSLTIERIVPEYTLAKLLGEREKTNKRLKEEGLFNRNKSLSIPFLPARIGILTSASGTVVHDFRVALESAKFGFKIFWLPVSVQGSGARSSLSRGLKALIERGELDLILLFRGGGSVADLAVFNDYEIAKTICLSPIPVFTAIGHEEDQCSAQDVSAHAFGVPRDIGKYLADRIIELRSGVALNCERVVRGANSLVDRALQDIEQRARLLVSGSLRLSELKEERILALNSKLHMLAKGLHVRMEERLRQHDSLAKRALQFVAQTERELTRLEAHVSEASPETQLNRGYTLIRRESDGGYIVRASAAKAGEGILIQFADDSLTARIIAKMP